MKARESSGATSWLNDLSLPQYLSKMPRHRKKPPVAVLGKAWPFLRPVAAASPVDATAPAEIVSYKDTAVEAVVVVHFCHHKYSVRNISRRSPGPWIPADLAGLSGPG
jgi:hypothetical protein